MNRPYTLNRKEAPIGRLLIRKSPNFIRQRRVISLRSDIMLRIVILPFGQFYGRIKYHFLFEMSRHRRGIFKRKYHLYFFFVVKRVWVSPKKQRLCLQMRCRFYPISIRKASMKFIEALIILIRSMLYSVLFSNSSFIALNSADSAVSPIFITCLSKVIRPLVSSSTSLSCVSTVAFKPCFTAGKISSR